MIRTSETHAFFFREWPSNFCKTKFKYSAFGETHEFFCTEQAFMWAKAKFFGDVGTAEKILKVTDDPMACKLCGREVSPYDDDAWAKVRYQYMHDVNLERFRQDLGLKAKLLDPMYDGLIFVEASPYDKIWGVKLSQDDPKILDPKNWKGQNLLGKAITQVRAEILQEESKTHG